MAPSEEALSIATMLDTILERLVGGFEQAGVDLPDRRYWTTGTPSIDCEQVTVSFNQAYIGPPGDEANEPQKCNSPRTAQLSIQIARCIPGMVGPKSRAPSGEAMQEAAKKQVIDAWVLLDISSSFDTWDADLPGRGLGVIATVNAGEPQGGYQVTTLQLTVAIP